MRLDRKGFEPSYFLKYHILNITRLPISPPIYFKNELLRYIYNH